MCFSCPDFIDQCGAEGCYNPNGGPYGKFRIFYIGELYCEHMKKKYGHDTAKSTDRYGVEEDDS